MNEMNTDSLPGSGLLLGMAAGAALGAAGMMAMNQNPRQVKRTARNNVAKVMKARNAP